MIAETYSFAPMCHLHLMSVRGNGASLHKGRGEYILQELYLLLRDALMAVQGFLE